MDVGRPSLDQLAVFVAVIETGSFNAAARKLGRAVSAISYAIATLETQLGVTVFDRQGSRPPGADRGPAARSWARRAGWAIRLTIWWPRCARSTAGWKAN